MYDTYLGTNPRGGPPPPRRTRGSGRPPRPDPDALPAGSARPRARHSGPCGGPLPGRRPLGVEFGVVGGHRPQGPGPTLIVVDASVLVDALTQQPLVDLRE